MNKKIMITMAATISMTLAGCSNLIDDEGYENNAVEKETSSEIKLPEIVNLTSADAVTERLENKESFALVIGDETCPACITYNSTLKEMKDKDDILLDYIDLNLVDEEEMEKVGLLLLEVLNVGPEGFATPTTFFVKDGKLEDTIVGAIGYEELKESYEENVEAEEEDGQDDSDDSVDNE